MTISEFLDRETNTKLSLLRFLYLEGHWYSTKKIADSTEMDQRTVLKYLKLLQADSLLYLETDISPIQQEKGKGHRFVGDALDYHRIYFQLVKNSINFSFLTDLYFYDEIDVEDFCERHYISDTVAKKIFKRGNDFFKPYELQLTYAKGKVTFTGNERSIRYFGYIFFWGLFKGITWPFEEIIEEEHVKSFLEKQFSRYSIMKTISHAQWCYILAVNICRIKNGHEITADNLPEYAEELNQTLFFTSSEVFDSEMLLENFYALYPTTRAEFDYFALITQIGVRVYLIPSVLDRAFAFHKQNQTPIYTMYELLTDTFSEELKNADSETQKLVDSLIFATFITASLFPSFNTTVTGYDFDNYLSLTFPSLRKEMSSRLEAMRQHSDSPLLKDESLLVSRFCELYSLVGHPSDFNPVIHIKLETDLPIVMEKVISMQLASALSPFFKISILSPIEVQEAISPDLIIASTQIRVEEQSVNIVYINPALAAKDIKLITEKVSVINKIKAVQASYIS
ncbi:helix-turn-helix domain-containing protein [Enterococcus sp. BWR-S5]|uniref:helix-turn-helix domain-containing protein n=1 Tax=Enterococcus sp. BWR-S5 TaxID=2787714 RepID=UPI001920705D|nr:helix-turn-helix domain-containing protein [Enterococcus sp. BWR-S5]MBL1224045.1 helix-turn-helix domain-containing protein [Enterococcus sp. BWR-S5]